VSFLDNWHYRAVAKRPSFLNVYGIKFKSVQKDVRCATTGKTREEVEKRMREALAFHLEGMLKDGDPIPMPHTSPDDPEIPHGSNYTSIYMDIRSPNVAA
jgi:hypothetical protein